MDNQYKPQIKTRKIRHWFTRKHYSKLPPSISKQISDESGDEYEEDASFMSSEIDPCILTDELRIFVATWNVAGRSPVGSLAVDLDEWLNVKESADIYVLGFQEIVPLKAKTVIGAEDMTEATNWNIISRVKVSAVACGIMGYLGNKGSVSVSMSIEGTSFCFVVAHLASGEKKGDEGRRNHQVSEIFKRTTFTRQFQDECTPQPLTILGHELYLENDLARELIKKQDWSALQEFDQLRQELGDGGVFQGWKEGNIEFAPTYKYSTFNSNRYSGTLPSRAGEKQRTPAWCDRILWYGKGVKQHSYFRSESKFSDHRPVSALFSTKIELIKSDVPNTVSSKQTEQERGKGAESTSSTLHSLLSKEAEAQPSNTKGHRINKRH
ncbi:hypothetical protein M8C21_000850 [Ambrosia artemisiifolia]|uniref:Inositol polyphosphate-related phosphatase domain-containing protein n=1 Tax=Ambrosia artemisiifolia TaxID=4212 RepID=A0AAD5CHI5_AMBAR|nr:hypothetical protein M8C21_000850 [Ambrosia artemisiifolia]